MTALVVDASMWVSAADRANADLVAWDNELVERAGGLTPGSWLTRSGVHEP